jgi:hypothetical protein
VLAAVLARQATAAVPGGLCEATVQAGALFAAGSAAAGAVPAGAVSLAEGVVRSMFWAKVRTLAAVGVALVLVVLGTGGGLFSYGTLGAAPAGVSADRGRTVADRRPDRTAYPVAAEPDDPKTADDPKKAEDKHKESVEKGLKWLVEQQKKDGHWEAAGGQFSVSMTAFAGLALLSEGSTTKEGKYKDQLGKAVQWTLAQAQQDGRLSDPNDKAETGRYIMSHGYAMLFLSQVYAKETDEKRHKEIGKVLEKAVEFAKASQTTKGGWGYVAAKEGNDFDEGCATEIVLHGLFATRKAGVAVPKELVKSSLDYLAKSDKVIKDDKDNKKKESGVLYSLAQAGAGEARPALTAAGAALLLNAGEKSDLTNPWLNFVRRAVPIAKGARLGHDEYTLFYYAQAVHQLGDDGHAKLRPDLAEAETDKKESDALLKWSRFRGPLFDALVGAQQADGSWKSTVVGDIYPTATYLIILQLDKGNLPFCKR